MGPNRRAQERESAAVPWLTVQRHQTRVTGVLPAMLHLKFPA
jgi:hypothetical protein